MTPGDLRYTGVVKWFDVDKAYGFIVPDAGGADVFVHIKSLEEREPALQAGESVEFSIGAGKKPGTKAAVRVTRRDDVYADS